MPEIIPLLMWLGKPKRQISLVFTDIVGSTKLAISKGDDAWVNVLRCHFIRARELKTELHGYEVKLIGDACMIAFETALPALKFALEFYRWTGHEAVKIRAAVHVGEITVVDGDMYGVMINYTSRLLKAAPLGGIVVSDKAMVHVRNQLGDNFRDAMDMIARGPQHVPEILGEFATSEQTIWRPVPKPPPPTLWSPRRTRKI